MIKLITEEVEIDLYECLRYDPFRHYGQIRAYVQPPYNQTVYLPLARTRQLYGYRLWFLAPCCQIRTSKLYAVGSVVACRHCLDLKYASQYKKNADFRLDMNRLKLARLEKQRRRLWYADKLTQFGRQFYSLREEQVKLEEQARTELQTTLAKLVML